MKKLCFVLLCYFFAIDAIAQDVQIMIDGRPIDPKNAFLFSITKRNDEIKLVYKSVDSIGKLTVSKEDLQTINRLLKKESQFFDSLTQDSLMYFQQKLDRLSAENTYYKTDSTTIYKSTHPAFWKLITTISITPSAVLQAKHGESKNTPGTYCFFTLRQNAVERKVHIDELDDTLFPLLSKLTNESFNIIRTYQIVKNRKNKE